MNELVSQAQNAFIKKRCIHDNFLYVQRVIQFLHKKKQPALFIKLDISKAFDSIGWQYLLEVLTALGFSTKWRNWISSILGTSSSKILINGRPNRNIKHAKGLRQGDPLSPLLFIIAIDPLQRIIEKAAQHGLLQPVLPKQAKLRCSLYADDAALFANPLPAELDRLQKNPSVFW
jgi:retron-type reverse transcriptase